MIMRPPEIIQPFPDAEEPKSACRRVRRFGLGRVKTGPFVSKRHLNPAIFDIPHSDPGMFDAGMSNDIEEEFANGFKQEDANLLGLRLSRCVGRDIQR